MIDYVNAHAAVAFWVLVFVMVGITVGVLLHTITDCWKLFREKKPEATPCPK